MSLYVIDRRKLGIALYAAMRHLTVPEADDEFARAGDDENRETYMRCAEAVARQVLRDAGLIQDAGTPVQAILESGRHDALDMIVKTMTAMLKQSVQREQALLAAIKSALGLIDESHDDVAVTGVQILRAAVKAHEDF